MPVSQSQLPTDQEQGELNIKTRQVVQVYQTKRQKIKKTQLWKLGERLPVFYAQESIIMANADGFFIFYFFVH